jgi:hypothetical protein
MLTLTYVVTSESDRVIDGLGVFKAGETVELEASIAENFQRIRGVALLADNLPEDVDLALRLWSYPDEEV